MGSWKLAVLTSVDVCVVVGFILSPGLAGWV